MDDDSVSLQCCTFNVAKGIYLWVATNPTTIQQVEWSVESNEWTTTQQIRANGRANIGCYTWSSTDTIEYLMPVNFNNEVNFMWRDGAIPTSSWVNTTAKISGVLPNTALGYTDKVFVQLQNTSLAGYTVTFDAADTSVAALDPQHVIPFPAYGGTALSVTGLNDGLAVITHSNGSDLVKNLLVTDVNGITWSSSPLPVPIS
jgi:hypothetical protein